MENEVIDPAMVPAAEASTVLVATPVPGDVIEELLVEEISIDGMCGVY